MDCNHNSIAGANGGKLMQPFCSKQCICDNTVRFTPVCPIDSVQTYYSPCHAGCSSETVFNGQRVRMSIILNDTEVVVKYLSEFEKIQRISDSK